MVKKSGELKEEPEANNVLKFENQLNNSVNSETEQSAEIEISEDPSEIREQIEETRRGMGETLDAIQEKLSFSNISEQVKEQVSEQITGAVETLKTTVSDATIGKAGKFMKNLGQEIKKSDITKLAGENPLPLVLIGLGIGLLVFRKYQGDSSSGYEKYRYKKNSHNAETQDSAQKKISDKVSGISQSIGDSASAAYEGVTKAASSTYHSVSGAAGDTYEKIGDLGGQLKNQYNTHLQKNPLIVGAIALAAGAAVGLAFPSTRYEGQLMGEARENLMSKAEDTARGAYEKVQEVVGQAKDTIVEEVKNQTATT